MIEIKKEDILKDTPEYEEYDNNEVSLSIEEMRELGLLKCGGCCQNKKGDKEGGCGKKTKCCRKK
ncbi:hypothetical protein [Clostridium chauvoei]|uniref:Uncharacterized protein n=2 Tax=Clostridium chauvoei TaxID=46867 RepID=S6F1D0_9CLOT|nr:hypothetical protein [Clostridium chauvoei]ATD55668.1 hypothetical protein BTM20_10645 [Clostridium chauvoei]ATD56655.1 hypothetical protein BTM21_02375 [Clostridium chauvoei]MBX7280092.1 hypothetical protein [Clostridium chauvoei]MBX7282576.1 hypothetical protein [Clostridium chauvoei]MBX7284983.1 hypothetical protein [Clostridium chauvoei]